MATVPLSATDIYLLKGIPFNRDYKNTRWFDSRAEQTSYFNSRSVVHSMGQASFQRTDGGTSFIKVNKNTDDLWGVNYVKFRNRGKWFFAFVTFLEYVNDGLTAVHFEVDVLQTWLFDVKFKPSYVVREHRPLWNSDGSPVINTLDEGLEYGDQYETVSMRQWNPHDDLLFLVIAMKENKQGQSTSDDDELSTDITPSFNAVPQPLTYYVHPFTKAMTNPTISVGGKKAQSGGDLANGLTASHILNVIEGVSSQQGTVNNVVSIYVTDSIGLSFDYNSSEKTIDFPKSTFAHAHYVDSEAVYFSTVRVKEVLTYTSKRLTMGNKYEHYTKPKESKLLMHPYTSLVLEDFKGNQVEYKNEMINGQTLEVICKGSIGTSNKVAYGVTNYQNTLLPMEQRYKQSLNDSLINSDPQDIPSIDDMLSAYLQGNRNSIKTERKSVMFNAVTDVVGGAAMGQANINHVSSARRIPSAVGLVMSAKDVVKGAGNAVLDLQAINSKIKDISNTPASLNSMGGNINFDVGHGYTGIHVIKKEIRPEYRRKLTDFFHMYGYKFNEVKIPNFHTRKHFNYVQTNSITVTGDLNNDDLVEFKEVFDNGITLWHTNDIGNYDLTNGVR